MSIYDVAKLAGVSKSTVSRVINGREGVSATTVDAVRSAMATLRYQPSDNRPGRRPRPRPLRDAASNGEPSAPVRGAVGLISVGRGVDMLAHPYFVRMQSELRRGLRRLGISLVLDEMAGPEPPMCTSESRVDGVLLTGRSPCPEIHAALGDAPAVWISGGAAGRLFADQVLADNHAVGVIAADYLAQAGCRDVVFMNADPYQNSSATRSAAFLEHASELGLRTEAIVYEKQGCFSGDWLDDALRSRLTELNARLDGRRRPDGVFLPYDQQAAVLQRLLDERGVRAGPPGPDTDIVMISVENNAYLATMQRRIASIDVSLPEMTRWSIERLLARIAEPWRPPVRILVRPDLVEPAADPPPRMEPLAP